MHTTTRSLLQKKSKQQQQIKHSAESQNVRGMGSCWSPASLLFFFLGKPLELHWRIIDCEEKPWLQTQTNRVDTSCMSPFSTWIETTVTEEINVKLNLIESSLEQPCSGLGFDCLRTVPTWCGCEWLLQQKVKTDSGSLKGSLSTEYSCWVKSGPGPCVIS